MYVILVNDDNTLLTTKRERIMQRSKLFDTFWFLANPTYRDYDMAGCTVLLEYTLPVSRKYCTEILVLDAERYEDHLKYTLPIDTNLTAEAGDIELQLSFILSDLDDFGNSIQRVRKTMTTTVTITPISAWSDIIPDSALTALDQRIIKMDAQIKAINEANEMVGKTKADNISYNEDTRELQLMANGEAVGDIVVLGTCPSETDGLPAVDIGESVDAEGSENAVAVVLF